MASIWGFNILGEAGDELNLSILGPLPLNQDLNYNKLPTLAMWSI